MRRKLSLAVPLACLLSLQVAVIVAQVAVVAAQVAAEKTPKVWVGRYEELENYIKTSPIARVEDIPLGVTRPRHGFFAPGGPIEGVAIKALRPSRDTGYFESYQSEIAAYELDKLLGMDMVPVTVEKLYEGKPASAQLWVNDTVFRKTLRDQKQEPPNPVSWVKQTNRWRVFDNLIENIDRNEGNLLVLRSPDWHLVLIDHSRAFTNQTKMIFEMTQIDRPFYDKLKALDAKMLDVKISKLVLDGSRSILRRRDMIVAHFEKLAKQNGEARVFTTAP
jgi:hypothetical protein